MRKSVPNFVKILHAKQNQIFVICTYALERTKLKISLHKFTIVGMPVIGLKESGMRKQRSLTLVSIKHHMFDQKFPL